MRTVTRQVSRTDPDILHQLDTSDEHVQGDDIIESDFIFDEINMRKIKKSSNRKQTNLTDLCVGK